MKNTKRQVEDAILTLAKKVDQVESFEKLIESNVGLPKLVEMITYQLFLKGFDIISCDDELFEAHQIVWKYAIELQTNGFVGFEK